MCCCGCLATETNVIYPNPAERITKVPPCQEDGLSLSTRTKKCACVVRLLDLVSRFAFWTHTKHSLNASDWPVTATRWHGEARHSGWMRACQNVFVSLHWVVTPDDLCVCSAQTSLDVVSADVSFICIRLDTRAWKEARRGSAELGMVYVCGFFSPAPSRSFFLGVRLVTKSSMCCCKIHLPLVFSWRN